MGQGVRVSMMCCSHMPETNYQSIHFVTLLSGQCMLLVDDFEDNVKRNMYKIHLLEALLLWFLYGRCDMTCCR